jgi:hypothetical protein
LAEADGAFGLGAGADEVESITGPGAVFVNAGAAAGVSMGVGAGAFVACCAIAPQQSKDPHTSHKVVFIIQHSRDLISGSVNVLHLPSRSSPSLILPI